MSGHIVKVRAGQIYKAKAKRGWRFVRVEAVHAREHTPWVRLLEVAPDGSERTGRARDGFLYSQPFYSALTCVDGRWSLLGLYTEVQS